MRNQFENNAPDRVPEEIIPYETFPYVILPPIRDDLIYKLIPIADGRVGVVIERK